MTDAQDPPAPRIGTDLLVVSVLEREELVQHTLSRFRLLNRPVIIYVPVQAAPIDLNDVWDY